MITKENVYDELQDVYCMLDADVYPGLHGYLEHLLGNEERPELPLYEIAGMLVGLDMPDPLPGYVIDLITGLYEAEIADGNANAMNDLGAQYYDGSRGFEQDYSKSVYYYAMAAAKGHRLAQENLGYCYYYGRNMPVDYEKAFHYFALGAFSGQLVSLYKIGDMYRNGLYVEKNETEAFRIYEECMDRMDDGAEHRVAGPVFLRLGDMFLNGTGTDRDAKKALICYQKAEFYLYDMVAGGDKMYRGSLLAAIDGQTAARRELEAAIRG